MNGVGPPQPDSRLGYMWVKGKEADMLSFVCGITFGIGLILLSIKN